MDENLIPQDIEAEKAVLGALMMEPNKLGIIQALLGADDFYRDAHRVIFRAMETLFDKEGNFDHITLRIYLVSNSLLTEAGGDEYLVEIIAKSASAFLMESYAKIVKDKAILRNLMTAGDSIKMTASKATEDIQDIIEFSEKTILAIGNSNLSNRPKELKQVVQEAYESIVRKAEEKKEIVGIPTGFYELDRITSGLMPHQLVILAARPSVGKTAFALNIAQNVGVKHKRPVIIFSLEMGAVELVNRMICAEGNIHASHLRTGQLTDEEWTNLSIASQTLRQSAPVFIDDSASIRVSEIRAKCQRIKQEYPDLGLIVIDYLQLIQGNGRENRQQEVSEISRQLKNLAKDLEVPVIALSQLSRNLEHRTNKRPMLSDIRESGSIEQDADIVAFLYREDYHQQEGDEKEGRSDGLPDNTVEVILAKNRSGALDTVKLLFTKEYNKFSSISFAEPPPR